MLLLLSLLLLLLLLYEDQEHLHDVYIRFPSFQFHHIPFFFFNIHFILLRCLFLLFKVGVYHNFMFVFRVHPFQEHQVLCHRKPQKAVQV